MTLDAINTQKVHDAAPRRQGRLIRAFEAGTRTGMGMRWGFFDRSFRNGPAAASTTHRDERGRAHPGVQRWSRSEKRTADLDQERGDADGRTGCRVPHTRGGTFEFTAVSPPPPARAPAFGKPSAVFPRPTGARPACRIPRRSPRARRAVT